MRLALVEEMCMEATPRIFRVTQQSRTRRPSPALPTPTESPHHARLSFAEVRAVAKREHSSYYHLSEAILSGPLCSCSCRLRKESHCTMGRVSGAPSHGSQSGAPHCDRGAQDDAGARAARGADEVLERGQVGRGEKRMHYKVEPFGSTSYQVCSPNSVSTLRVWVDGH
ncbi:hypothetical protein FIBSPDRAFT_591902 [Athelia psychrophila]|uniref:Uncharacterized protein n=1 Tax=Athelia psychrophila TaxID=1759441 RepID=A0A166H445_9AGAM|nr:hypothetical protein FIBSPDRAFT_591902 [Fibularhizoctonia sp. CBS 109695]